jgi:hypothetical protein
VERHPTRRQRVFPVPVGLSIRAFYLFFMAYWIVFTIEICCWYGSKGKNTLDSSGTK